MESASKLGWRIILLLPLLAKSQIKKTIKEYFNSLLLPYLPRKNRDAESHIKLFDPKLVLVSGEAFISGNQ